MFLRWREFERQTGRVLAEEIRDSPELKRQKRRAPRRNFARKLVNVILPLYALMAITLGFGGWASKRTGSASLLAVLWSAPITLFVATTWLNHLARVGEPIWQFLPLSREQIFRERLCSFWKPPIYLVILVATGCVCLFGRQEVISGMRVIPLIVLQTLIMAAGGLHLSAFFFRRRVAMTRLALLLAATIAIAPKFDEAVWALRDGSTFIMSVLPAGWVHRVVNGRDWSNWIYALPILLMLAAIPQSFHRMRGQFLDAISANLEAEMSAQDEEIENESGTNSAFGRGESELSDRIEKEFTGKQAVLNGPLEKIVDRLWAKKDRGTAEFLWPAYRGWTRAWIGSCKAMLICLTLAAASQTFIGWPVLSIGILAAGVLLSLPSAPLFTAAAGLRPFPNGGSLSPIYAAFPVSYDSMYRTLRIVSLVRWAAWTPLAIGYVTIVAWWTEFPILLTALNGFKVALLFLAIRPIFATIWIGQNTTIWRFWWSFVFICLGLLAMISAFVFVFAVFQTDAVAWLVQIGAWVATWLIAKAIQLLQRWIFRKRGLDLAHRPQAAYSSAVFLQ